MGVAAADDASAARARVLADRLQLPFLQETFSLRDAAPDQLVLWVADGIPSLRLTGPRAPGPVGVDFADAAMTHRRKGGQNELLGRAVGWKSDRPPKVLDGTAGFGRDAYVLADLGCDVLMCERHPVLAAMLEDAVERLRGADGARQRANAGRMTVWTTDVRQVNGDRLDDRDAIYLDPMFADASRGKALPGKEMQVLQRLHGDAAADDPTGAKLLDWARQQPVRRVVVKRPRHGAPLPGPAPGHTINGKAIRFDVYPLARGVI